MQFKIDSSNLNNVDKSECLNLDFDALLNATWEKAERDNVLKYKFSESIQERSLDGYYSFYCYLNVNRLVMKRPAQQMKEVKVTVNKDEFNFTKIEENEKLFDFVIENIDLQSNQDQLNLENENAEQNYQNRKIAGTIIVNNAPIEHCSSLLVPFLNDLLPQIYLKESLILALYVSSISTSKYLRLGFNSAGGNSSVNHNHWHLYYQKEDLLIAKLPIKNNQIINWFLRSLVFELDVNSTNKPEIYLDLSIKIEKLINYITDLKLAYNLFITKCSTSLNIIRLFIWPRLPQFIPKDSSKLNPAFSEFSGFFTIKNFEIFNSITQQELIEIVKKFEINENLFAKILNEKDRIFN